MLETKQDESVMQLILRAMLLHGDMRSGSDSFLARRTQSLKTMFEKARVNYRLRL
jgi:hypothetical protein